MWRHGGERRKIRRVHRDASDKSKPDPEGDVDINADCGLTDASAFDEEMFGSWSCPLSSSKSSTQHHLDDPIIDVDGHDWSDNDDNDYKDWQYSAHQCIYHQSCDVVGVRRNVSLSRCFQLQKICLRYNLLREKHVKTLAVTLMNNDIVESLDLRCCGLSTQSFQYICEMLTFNTTITSLDVSQNAPGTQGLVLLRDCLLSNSLITTFYLDDSGLLDADSFHISTILQNNTTLDKLSLRGNNFSIVAGEHFHNALVENTTLSVLDVGWNQIRMEGARFFAQGVAENFNLLELDLSWNGLGIQGSIAMAGCLKHNSTLEILDLSSNRISREAFQFLLEGLKVNQSLIALKIGDNPITTDGVMDLMNLLVNSSPEVVMKGCKVVDFADICVGGEFNQIYTEIKKNRQIQIKHGSTIKQADLIQIDLVTVLHSEQPVFILFDCMRKNNLRIVDLFHAFDKDKSGSLSRKEFKEGLRSMNIPLSSRALDLLVKRTDTDNDGEVSLTDLMAVQKDYQKYVNKKRNREQKERAESALLRRGRTPTKI